LGIGDSVKRDREQALENQQDVSIYQDGGAGSKDFTTETLGKH